MGERVVAMVVEVRVAGKAAETALPPSK